MKLNKPLVIVIIGVVLVIIYTIIMGLYFVSRWYDENRVVFQKPVIIKIQTPIKIEKRAKPNNKKQAPRPQNKPKKQGEKEIVMSMPHGDVLWKIYQLETQRGKTDSCRLNNKGYAGFGVMVEGNVYCYPTFEKAVERAEYWFSKLHTGSLASALCHWNTGVGGLDTCAYYQSYLSL